MHFVEIGKTVSGGSVGMGRLCGNAHRVARLREAVKMPKFSRAYMDALFSSHDNSKLVELSGYLQEGLNRGDPTYGYPQAVFVFMESLLWFAQAIRSGAWTYYEATPRARQQAMLRALEGEAPAGFATHYSLGMQNWQDESRIGVVDTWIEDHDEDNNRWLWRLANEHRATFERLCGQADGARDDAGQSGDATRRIGSGE
jgi:hypothetical protein